LSNKSLIQSRNQVASSDGPGEVNVKAFLTAGTSVRKLQIQSLSSPPGSGYFTGWGLELQRSEGERICWRHISFGNNLAEVSSRRYRRRCGGRIQSRRCSSSDICDYMQKTNRRAPVMTDEDATLLPVPSSFPQTGVGSTFLPLLKRTPKVSENPHRQQVHAKKRLNAGDRSDPAGRLQRIFAGLYPSDPISHVEFTPADAKSRQ